MPTLPQHPPKERRPRFVPAGSGWYARWEGNVAQIVSHQQSYKGGGNSGPIAAKVKIFVFINDQYAFCGTSFTAVKNRAERALLRRDLERRERGEEIHDIARKLKPRDELMKKIPKLKRDQWAPTSTEPF